MGIMVVSPRDICQKWLFAWTGNVEIMFVGDSENIKTRKVFRFCVLFFIFCYLALKIFIFVQTIEEFVYFRNGAMQEELQSLQNITPLVTEVSGYGLHEIDKSRLTRARVNLHKWAAVYFSSPSPLDIGVLYTDVENSSFFLYKYLTDNSCVDTTICNYSFFETENKNYGVSFIQVIQSQDFHNRTAQTIKIINGGDANNLSPLKTYFKYRISLNEETGAVLLFPGAVSFAMKIMRYERLGQADNSLSGNAVGFRACWTPLPGMRPLGATNHCYTLIAISPQWVVGIRHGPVDVRPIVESLRSAGVIPTSPLPNLGQP